MRALAAEFLGTFVLVFAGTGALVVDAATGGTLTHVGVAAVFGLVVLAMIQAFGDVSGAHLNPAVSLAFAVSGRFERTLVAPYAAAQLGGALAASLLLALLFPDDATLGATRPAGAPLQAFALEVVLAFVLVLVILAVSTGSRERGLLAGVAIGAVIGLEALFAGPVSGASMNPARSLAPALVTGDLRQVWIYVTAPTLGALLAVPACRLSQPRDCCPGRACA